MQIDDLSVLSGEMFIAEEVIFPTSAVISAFEASFYLMLSALLKGADAGLPEAGRTAVRVEDDGLRQQDFPERLTERKEVTDTGALASLCVDVGVTPHQAWPAPANIEQTSSIPEATEAREAQKTQKDSFGQRRRLALAGRELLPFTVQERADLEGVRGSWLFGPYLLPFDEGSGRDRPAAPLHSTVDEPATGLGKAMLSGPRHPVQRLEALQGVVERHVIPVVASGPPGEVLDRSSMQAPVDFGQSGEAWLKAAPVTPTGRGRLNVAERPEEGVLPVLERLMVPGGFLEISDSPSAEGVVKPNMTGGLPAASFPAVGGSLRVAEGPEGSVAAPGVNKPAAQGAESTRLAEPVAQSPSAIGPESSSPAVREAVGSEPVPVAGVSAGQEAGPTGLVKGAVQPSAVVDLELSWPGPSSADTLSLATAPEAFVMPRREAVDGSSSGSATGHPTEGALQQQAPDLVQREAPRARARAMEAGTASPPISRMEGAVFASQKPDARPVQAVSEEPMPTVTYAVRHEARRTSHSVLECAESWGQGMFSPPKGAKVDGVKSAVWGSGLDTTGSPPAEEGHGNWPERGTPDHISLFGGPDLLPENGRHAVSDVSVVRNGTSAAGQALRDADILGSLVDRIYVAWRRGESECWLQLRPDHLGRVEIRLVSGRDGITLLMRTETPEAQALIQANLDWLRVGLAGQGIHLERCEVVAGQIGAGLASWEGQDFSGREALWSRAAVSHLPRGEAPERAESVVEVRRSARRWPDALIDIEA